MPCCLGSLDDSKGFAWHGPGALPGASGFDEVEVTAWPLVDAQTLAGLLSVSADWVRTHAEELGGFRLCSGPKAPWRFDVAGVIHRLRTETRQRSPPESEEASTRERRPRRSRVEGQRVALFETENEA